MSIPQKIGGKIESRDQLAEYLASGCKPKDEWKIGTEHEKFGYSGDTLKPLPYEGPRSIRATLEGLRDEFGWEPICEGGKLIGLSSGSANISLEPGGQLELSGAPLGTLHETCDEVNQHLVEVQAVASRIGAKFIGLGASPDWTQEEMPMMPKGRYKLMTSYMGKVGRFGTHMMYRTCSVQVNLDYASEADMVKKLRVGLALQPVATALFANSPFFDGKPTGYKSWRSRVWQDLDADRTGMLPFVFDDGFGFEAWVDYALSVPMYFVYRDGRYIDALGQSFRDFLEGNLPALPGETPLLSDWADHLTTIFPEARIKTFIEMRGADGGPWRRLCALPAYWVGLLYDDDALDAAWDLVKGMDAEARECLRRAAAKDGLDAACDNFKVRELAVKSLEYASAGLRRRKRQGANGLIPDESHFLDPLQEIVETGVTASDELLKKYLGEWRGDMGPIYEEYNY